MTAEVLADGRTRFSLWASSASKVELILEDGETCEMARGDDGFFRVEAEACAGMRYRFRITNDDGELEVPDPASRFQPDDVRGSSEVVDPASFDRPDSGWTGRPWHETVLYELHVGAFTPEGTYRAAADRLDHLSDLGITMIELMPLSDFPGRRNWGYDGVLPYAPDSSYGRPEDLRSFVAAAHERGISVILDVVYNHFGPEGNYLNAYAPQFFTDRHETPWGAAINLDGEGSDYVREFFVQNALYWLEAYGFDGFRLDAVHAILDDSEEHFLTELARRIQAGPGSGRHVHLILENEENESSRLRSAPDFTPYSAQWNDDVHHALHVAATGQSDSYYADYADAPVTRLGRCLTEGFAFQGDASLYRDDERGEPSDDLPPTRFVSFIQNHDQVGNRAFGDRITETATEEAVRAIAAVYLLAPQIPMVFMGEEWGASTPFRFFCDFEPDLAKLVTEGRREEFATFPEFSDPETRKRIPDPSDEETFHDSELIWDERGDHDHGDWLDFYQEVIALRHREMIPRLKDIPGGQAQRRMVGERGLRVHWPLGDGSLLTLLANLGDEPSGGFEDAPGELIFATNEIGPDDDGFLPAWTVAWYLLEGS